MALCKALSYRTLKCAGKAKREREQKFHDLMAPRMGKNNDMQRVKTVAKEL